MAGIAFVSVCFLCVFLARDAQLLSAGLKPDLRWRLGLYWIVLSVCVLAASKLVPAGPKEIIMALRLPWIWGVSVGLHVTGLSICLWLRYRHGAVWAWLAGLFPTPLLTLLLLAAAGTVAPAFPGGFEISAWIVALGWTLIVGAAGKLMELIGGSDSEFAINFAAASNTTALVLFPLGPFF